MADKGAPRKRAWSFYAPHYHSGEAEDLEELREPGLEAEAAMLRVSIRRVFALADGVDDLEEAVSLLGALGIAAARLASILRTQKILNTGGDSALRAVVSQALSEVLHEMKVK